MSFQYGNCKVELKEEITSNKFKIASMYREEFLENGDDIVNASIHKKITMMCPRCYNYEIVDVDWNVKGKITNNKGGNIESGKIFPTFIANRCDYCGNEEYNPLEIDINIADLIQKFNQKGYYTKFCCSGHGSGDHGYIYFEKPYDILLNNSIYLPDSVNIDLNDLKEGNLIFRFDYFDLKEAIEDMTEWIDQLSINIVNVLGEPYEDFYKYHRCEMETTYTIVKICR